MCGIMATINNIFNENVIKSAFDNGVNRGPENSQYINYINLSLYFHRLAINGINTNSNQPIIVDNIVLICNGEIYNYKTLYKLLNITPQTNSDCEVIIHLYKNFGLENMLNMLDGVFAFVLYDINLNKVFVSRDLFGVRPLYILKSCDNNINIQNYVVSSELKVIRHFKRDNNVVSQFTPGTYTSFNLEYKNNTYSFKLDNDECFYSNILSIPSIYDSLHNSSYLNIYFNSIYNSLCDAVKKRVLDTTERPIACLLSGGLDSSLIAALVSKYSNKKIDTYSIGMEGSEDLKKARLVSEHIHSNHHEVVLTKDEFFNAIENVIYNIESYDTTTVRASVGNYLIANHISNTSDAKVIFNGDGSDELTGGYIYMLASPNNIEFDLECKRLLGDIHYFDVLRSDRSVSSNGLEPRTPFLDKTFVYNYLSIPAELRNPRSEFNKRLHLWDKSSFTNKRPEKLLLRYSVYCNNPTLLPEQVLWRTKEAFSDGVSGNDGDWFQIIKDNIEQKKLTNSTLNERTHNNPETKEQLYYRNIFEKYYKNLQNTTPYFWMPKFIKANDASARTLDIYKTL
jgi:asparagine synthase (glutamine-hydrolysing)